MHIGKEKAREVLSERKEVKTLSFLTAGMLFVHQVREPAPQQTYLSTCLVNEDGQEGTECKRDSLKSYKIVPCNPDRQRNRKKKKIGSSKEENPNILNDQTR